MGKKLTDLRNILYGITGLEALVSLFFREALGPFFWVGILLSAGQMIILYYLFDRFESYTVERSSTVRDSMSDAAAEAFLYGEVGMVGYDDEHVVTWMSDLFEERGINRVERKLLPWLPEADDLVSGVADKATARLDDRIYEITKKEDDRVLFFKDITETEKYRQLYTDERPVVGLASLDNYEESTQYEDEAVVSAINIAVRTPLTEYCKDHGILIRRVNNYRYMLMLNEKIYSELVADHFSIVNTVRRAAQKQDVTITLSMAFAMDAPNYQQLDDMVTRLLDLAQSRGGDQVAVQKGSNDVKYFGGSSEAAEKRSRVRVRVMAHSLRELIARSSNVIICGHKEMDFDCLGSALGMARICEAMNRPCVIIEKTGGIEEKLKAAVNRHIDALNEEVHFVTESEALNQLQEKTLVIMVDHYSAKTSNGQKVLDAASRVAIIDHHRRTSDIGVKPVFVYIEAGASSACELITELIPYISNRIELSEIDATFMLAGMTIDTQRFRARTGVRTFEAASSLRRMGANQQLVDEYLKDSYGEYALKAKVISCSKRISDGIILVPYKDGILTRTMLSQVADSLLDIQNVDAVFAIAGIDDGVTAVSARSNGRINVQIIMEKMNGGGHMTAAAVQIPDTTVDRVETELKEKLDEYFEEMKDDEGNTEE
ncbi:MAG: DHH family phosphoesterase [Solobacterium sp.]|nr:DHH family phosphoesterase [Solobacterium sp.]